MSTGVSKKMSGIANQQGVTNTAKYWNFVCLTFLSFFATAAIVIDATQLPRIRTSVDNYRCVCPGEPIYLSCSARNSRSHSWSSVDYFGQNAIIEFSQDYDRPGKGKRVSLPDGRSSLAQMTAIDASTLQITIPRELNETRITCANVNGAVTTKTFVLSRERPTPPTFLQPKVIAENATSGIKVYRFMWELPAKNESTDISHLKFQLDDEPPVILMSNSTDIILPLSYGQHNASIVAVDRCNRTSDSSVLQVDVQKGVSKEEKYNSEQLLNNSARGMMSMMNVLYFMLSLLFVIALSI